MRASKMVLWLSQREFPTIIHIELYPEFLILVQAMPLVSVIVILVIPYIVFITVELLWLAKIKPGMKSGFCVSAETTNGPMTLASSLLPILMENLVMFALQGLA